MKFYEIKNLPGTWFKNTRADSKLFIAKAVKNPEYKYAVKLTYISISKRKDLSTLQTDSAVDWNLAPLDEKEEKPYREAIKIAFGEY